MNAPPDISTEVLERARGGDPSAHAVLYDAYAPMVFTLARRMLGSKAAAEDALQDCFVEVIRKARQYRGDAGVSHWIKRIAINKCLSYLRSPWVSRRVEPANGTDGPSADPASAQGVEQRLGLRDELEQALDALSGAARAVVWLHDVEGYTHEEIGRLMGRSTSFSKSQLARAYRELRVSLESRSTNGESETCIGLLKTV